MSTKKSTQRNVLSTSILMSNSKDRSWRPSVTVIGIKILCRDHENLRSEMSVSMWEPFSSIYHSKFQTPY